MSDRELFSPEYRYEVNTYGDPEGSYAGNMVRYDNVPDCEAGARDLYARWTAVKHWRVIDDMDKVHVTGPEPMDVNTNQERGALKIEMY